MKHYTMNDGRPFVVRPAAERDAESLITCSKLAFASTDQLLTRPEEYTITPEAERNWINGFTNNPNALLLVAEFQGQVIGMLFFVPNNKTKNAHSGEFGMNVHPDHQRQGVGKALLTSLLEFASASAVIEKVYLQVFATNERAIRLYTGLGFTEEGRHRNAVRQPSGEFVDVLQMFIMTNR